MPVKVRQGLAGLVEEMACVAGSTARRICSCGARRVAAFDLHRHLLITPAGDVQQGQAAEPLDQRDLAGIVPRGSSAGPRDECQA